MPQAHRATDANRVVSQIENCQRLCWMPDNQLFWAHAADVWAIKFDVANPSKGLLGEATAVEFQNNAPRRTARRPKLSRGF